MTRFKSGQVLDDRYELRWPLGRSGVGRVWMGEDRARRLPCAIKVESRAAGSSCADDLAREATLLRRIESPDIVRLDDDRSDAAIPHLVFEYVAGRALAAMISERRGLGLERAGRVVRQIATAVAFVHRAGIVHGDISPENVILLGTDDDARIKLVDFGFARDVDAHGSGPQGGGALRYLSPEVLLGATVDPSADCWALAVMLFECVYGCAPFDGRTATELLVQIEHPLIVPPAFSESTDLLLHGFFERCFSCVASSRFRNARTMGETFSALVAEASHLDGGAWENDVARHEDSSRVSAAR